jgi:hypothetical protein
MRIESYADQFGLIRGLGALRQQGLTPRGILFLALNSQGRIYLAVSQDPHQLDQSSLRIGEKLALRWPERDDVPQRLYHFDSIHALREDFCVLNGDRRLMHPGNAIEVGGVVARFIRGSGVTSAFFGCTPHQPGTWLQGGKQVVSLHDYGVVEAVPVPTGLLARRLHDHRLYLLTFADIARTGHLEGWLPVYASPLGNILMVERRVVQERLVLSCERGLVEVDLHDLPRVHERMQLCFPEEPSSPSEALDEMEDEAEDQRTFPVVLGRLGSEAFVLTRGRLERGGFLDIAPAELWGAPTGELVDIQKWLGQSAPVTETL